MRLYFLRHGIAEDRALAKPDFDRELVPEGYRKLDKLNARLSDFGVQPTVIYSSPKLRALQTAEHVATVLDVDVEVDDRIANGFSLAVVQSLVNRHQRNDDLMFVGHEPTFSMTISDIIGGGEITLKKAALARVDLYRHQPLEGSLVWLVAPKLF